MTTGTGINAYEPKFEKPYILLGSDSRATPVSAGGKRKSDKTFNVKKIIALQNSNVLFTHAGDLMNPEHMKIDQLQKQKEIAFLNAKNLNPQQIYYHLQRINHFANRTYILSIHNPLEMYMFETNGDAKRIAATMIGSGEKYRAIIFNNSIAEKETDKKTGLPKVPLKDSLCHTLYEINQASQKDPGTGGKFQFAISTDKSYIQLIDTVGFRKNLNPERSIKRIENEILENLAKEKYYMNSLEEILF